MIERVLAVDQGGQSSRAIVFDSDGQVLATAQAGIETRRYSPDRVEHDPEQLVSSVEQVIAEAVAEAGPVHVAGIATQRSSIVCWDRDTGEPLSPVISWQDRRAADWLRQLCPDPTTLHETTGLVASPHYGASKMRWCLDHLAPVQQARQRGRLAMGPVASYLLARIVAHRPCLADPVNASRTLLWDVTRQDWSPALCRAFGVPMEVLPRGVHNAFEFGRLGNGVPVRVCTGDQAAAVFAYGGLEPERVYINLGTGGFVLAPVSRRVSVPGLLNSVAWQDASASIGVLEGTVNGAASAIRQIQPGASDKEIAAAALQIGTREDLPLFLNGVSGLGSPFWRDNFESRLVGEGDSGGQLVAVLESILFLLQTNLELIPGLSARYIVISGGLARADGLCQALADLSGREVRRAQHAEATARGLAALLTRQRWPIGMQSFFPSADEILSRRYHRWQQLMRQALQE